MIFAYICDIWICLPESFGVDVRTVTSSFCKAWVTSLALECSPLSPGWHEQTREQKATTRALVPCFLSAETSGPVESYCLKSSVWFVFSDELSRNHEIHAFQLQHVLRLIPPSLLYFRRKWAVRRGGAQFSLTLLNTCDLYIENDHLISPLCPRISRCRLARCLRSSCDRWDGLSRTRNQTWYLNSTAWRILQKRFERIIVTCNSCNQYVTIVIVEGGPNLFANCRRIVYYGWPKDKLACLGVGPWARTLGQEMELPCWLGLVLSVLKFQGYATGCGLDSRRSSSLFVVHVEQSWMFASCCLIIITIYYYYCYCYYYYYSPLLKVSYVPLAQQVRSGRALQGNPSLPILFLPDSLSL